MATKSPEEIAADAALIDELGGPVKVAERLKWKEAGSVQRIHNWKTRGIPALIELRHPFLRSTSHKQQKVGAQ